MRPSVCGHNNVTLYHYSTRLTSANNESTKSNTLLQYIRCNAPPLATLVVSTSKIHVVSKRGSILHLVLRCARNPVAAETANQTHRFSHVPSPLPNTPHTTTNHHSRQHAGANNSLQLSQLAVGQRRDKLHRTRIRNLVVPETATHQ